MGVAFWFFLVGLRSGLAKKAKKAYPQAFESVAPVSSAAEAVGSVKTNQKAGASVRLALLENTQNQVFDTPERFD